MGIYGIIVIKLNLNFKILNFLNKKINLNFIKFNLL